MKLEIEMIPQTSFGCNLRERMTANQWNKIRNAIYERQDNKCAICGAIKGVDCKRLNAHELWEYDDKNHIQKLADIVALCDKCHNCIHIGRTEQVAKQLNDPSIMEDIINHYTKINNCSRTQFEKDKTLAYVDWLGRSTHEWKLDISHLKDMGFEEIFESIKKED